MSDEKSISEARFERVKPGGARETVVRSLADEYPVALEYDGIGYAVLMATPRDLADLAWGFTLSERLIDHAGQILEIDIFETGRGSIVRINLAPEVRDRIEHRVRHRASESSCGICGIENLEQALRPLPMVTSSSRADAEAVFRAYAVLDGHQPLNRLTGAVHAAAACTAEGDIILAREDVGRHNAFDKLIGAMAREGLGWEDGFALLSSRCSFELVEKAVLANCPLLATISAPTALALARARSAGLGLHVLVRRDALLADARA